MRDRHTVPVGRRRRRSAAGTGSGRAWLYEVMGAEARGAGRDTVDGVLRIAAFRSAAPHLTMVGRGLGRAIRPQLSLREAGEAVEITDLGPYRPVGKVGYVTVPESASTFAVCALIRELRSEKR
ncbi:hypothetical protein ACWFQ8_00790 [Streptomyces sp. NPDC055254]